jgi:hypothetical protein
MTAPNNFGFGGSFFGQSGFPQFGHNGGGFNQVFSWLLLSRDNNANCCKIKVGKNFFLKQLNTLGPAPAGNFFLPNPLVSPGGGQPFQPNPAVFGNSASNYFPQNPAAFIPPTYQPQNGFQPTPTPSPLQFQSNSNSTGRSSTLAVNHLRRSGIHFPQVTGGMGNPASFNPNNNQGLGYGLQNRSDQNGTYNTYQSIL